MSRTLSSRSFYSSRMSSYSASMMWKRLLAAGSIALVGIVALVVCSSRFRYTDSPHPSGIDVFDVPAKVTEKAGMLLLSELKKASKDLRSGKSVKPSELVKLPAVNDDKANDKTLMDTKSGKAKSSKAKSGKDESNGEDANPADTSGMHKKSRSYPIQPLTLSPNESPGRSGKQEEDGGTPSPSLSPTLTPTLSPTVSVSTIVILSYL